MIFWRTQHCGGELAAGCILSIIQLLLIKKAVRSVGWDSWWGFCSLFRDRQCTTKPGTNYLLKLDKLLWCLIKLQVFLLHSCPYHLFGYQKFASTILPVFYFVNSFPGCLLTKVKRNTKSYWHSAEKLRKINTFKDLFWMQGKGKQVSEIFDSYKNFIGKVSQDLI